MRLSALQIEEAKRVRKGAMLTIHPFWNRSTRGQKMDKTVRCEALLHGTRSQTGIEFLVTDLRGRRHWLDAAWFVFPDTPIQPDLF